MYTAHPNSWEFELRIPKFGFRSVLSLDTRNDSDKIKECLIEPPITNQQCSAQMIYDGSDFHLIIWFELTQRWSGFWNDSSGIQALDPKPEIENPFALFVQWNHWIHLITLTVWALECSDVLKFTNIPTNSCNSLETLDSNWNDLNCIKLSLRRVKIQLFSTPLRRSVEKVSAVRRLKAKMLRIPYDEQHWPVPLE